MPFKPKGKFPQGHHWPSRDDDNEPLKVPKTWDSEEPRVGGKFEYPPPRRGKQAPRGRRCGTWMPRAKKRCELASGHAGPHRSGR